MTTALYARCSTNRHQCRECKKRFPVEAEMQCPHCGSTHIEAGQRPETQLLPLRKYVEQRELGPVTEYIERGVSGSKESRPELDKMMTAVRAGDVSTVIVARLDRLGRSLTHLIELLTEFREHKVKFVSLAESIDTATPIGRLFFHVIGAFAQFERELIRERVMAGLARAQDEGIKLGRRPKIRDKEKIRQYYAEHPSLRKTAKHFKVSKETIQRSL